MALSLGSEVRLSEYGETKEVQIIPRIESTLTLDLVFGEPDRKNLIEIGEYDLNGDRDILCFNISKYGGKEDRKGSEKDAQILKETFIRKGFQVRAFEENEVSKTIILEKLNTYVKEIEKNQRDVKVLAIAFMAHGAEGDIIGG